MPESVTDKTPIPTTIERRHIDPPGLWIAILIGSVVLHSLLVWLMLSSKLNLVSRRSNTGAIPVQVVEVVPRKSRNTKRVIAQKPKVQPPSQQVQVKTAPALKAPVVPVPKAPVVNEVKPVQTETQPQDTIAFTNNVKKKNTNKKIASPRKPVSKQTPKKPVAKTSRPLLRTNTQGIQQQKSPIKNNQLAQAPNIKNTPLQNTQPTKPPIRPPTPQNTQSTKPPIKPPTPQNTQSTKPPIKPPTPQNTQPTKPPVKQGAGQNTEPTEPPVNTQSPISQNTPPPEAPKENPNTNDNDNDINNNLDRTGSRGNNTPESPGERISTLPQNNTGQAPSTNPSPARTNNTPSEAPQTTAIVANFTPLGRETLQNLFEQRKISTSPPDKIPQYTGNTSIDIPVKVLTESGIKIEKVNLEVVLPIDETGKLLTSVKSGTQTAAVRPRIIQAQPQLNPEETKRYEQFLIKVFEQKRFEPAQDGKGKPLAGELAVSLTIQPSNTTNTKDKLPGRMLDP